MSSIRALMGLVLVAAGAGLLGCGEPRTVTISWLSQYISEVGVSSTFDWLPREDGGIEVKVDTVNATRSYRGSHTDAGYAVPNVAGIDYLVRIDDRAWVSNEDTLDLGSRVMGRADVGLISEQQGQLELNASGLAPWADSDDLLFFSAGAGLYAYGLTRISAGVSAGGTSGTFSVAYGGLDGQETPAVDSSRGDTLWLSQMRDFTLSSSTGGNDAGVPAAFSCKRSVAMAQLKTFTASASPPNTPAAFSQLPQAMIPVQFPGSEWTTVIKAVHPGAVLKSAYFYADAAPEFSNGATTDLLYCSASLSEGQRPADVERTIALTEAIPATWPRRMLTGVTYQVSGSIKGGGIATQSGTTSVITALGQAARPGVHPPVSFTLGELEALKVEAVSAAAPLVVRWAPNSSGTAPTAYFVVLNQFENTSGNTTPIDTQSVRTSGTIVTFPADTMKKGQIAMVRVRAVDSTSTDSAPFRGVTTSSSDALSRPFLVDP